MRLPRPTALLAATAACSAVLAVSGAAAANAANITPTPLTSSSPVTTSSPQGDHQGPLAGLVANGTITKTQVDAIKAALEAQRSTDKTAHDKAKSDTLAALVSKGTITQAQATAITNADRHGLRDLVSGGTLTKDQLVAVITAFKDLKSAQGTPPLNSRLSSVLSSLVSKGTITQAQADAIAAAKPAHGAKGADAGSRSGLGKHGVRH